MAFKDILGKLTGRFIERGAEIADEFTLSNEEREEFRQRDEARAAELSTAIMEAAASRFEQVKAIIAAEMSQGDSYTKRARPSIVYAGLLLHLVKAIGAAFGLEVTIDPNFTYVWGAVCGVWIVGRSVEKVQSNGLLGQLANAVTGSKPANLPEF